MEDLEKREARRKLKENLITTSRNLLFYAIVYGLLLNYSLWAIFNVKFTWYTFAGYGIFLYLLKSDFIYIIKECLHRTTGVSK